MDEHRQREAHVSDQQSTPEQSGNGPVPLMYANPVPLGRTEHDGKFMRPAWNYEFANGAHAIPITAAEFVLVARHYPILFVGQDRVPVAAVGLSSNENLFIEADGRWKTGFYVPAYVRRYPFILMGADEQNIRVGIDQADIDRNWKKGEGRPLLEDGKESEDLKQAISLCEQFHGAYMQTAKLLEFIKDSDLLIERNMNGPVKSDADRKGGEFWAVDEEKYRALPDDKFLELRKSGFLAALHSHLASMNNWNTLITFARIKAGETVENV